MAIPRFFWTCASLALLIIAGSVSYFVLVDLPATQRHRDELEAKEQSDRQEADCAEQARKAADDFGKHPTGFGPPPTVTGSNNHYNRKFGKCFVDVQTADKNSTAEFLMDAYEQSSVLWCNTFFNAKAKMHFQRTCMDANNKPVEPEEADKQIDQLLHE